MCAIRDRAPWGLTVEPAFGFLADSYFLLAVARGKTSFYFISPAVENIAQCGIGDWEGIDDSLVNGNRPFRKIKSTAVINDLAVDNFPFAVMFTLWRNEVSLQV